MQYGRVEAQLTGMPFEALGAALDTLGVGAVHAPAIFRALHRELRPIEAVPTLGWRNQARLEGLFEPPVRLVRVAPDGGTDKLVFALRDGAKVEAVLIPTRPGRVTVCVSSQVGCAMGCDFCATATMGLARNLEAAEILGQVHAAMARTREGGARVTHVVFMGMGEPLANYPATRDAVRVLIDPRGCALATRHVTVSTVGLVPAMRRFALDFGGRVQLALSLHAGTDATRRRIIPVAQTYDLAALRQACLEHPLPQSRCLMLEYVVLPGTNDTDAELDALAAWTRGLRCLVNLIPFNPFPGARNRSPTRAEVERVAERLHALRVPASVRWPRGRGVAGACGQLALTDTP